jgi:hypothetical protein
MARRPVHPDYLAAFEAGRTGGPEVGVWSSSAWEAYQIGAHLRAIDADPDCRLVAESFHRRCSGTVESFSGTFEYRVNYHGAGQITVTGQEV